MNNTCLFFTREIIWNYIPRNCASCSGTIVRVTASLSTRSKVDLAMSFEYREQEELCSLFLTFPQIICVPLGPRLSCHVSWRGVNCHPQHAMATCPLSRHTRGRPYPFSRLLSANQRRLVVTRPTRATRLSLWPLLWILVSRCNCRCCSKESRELRWPELKTWN